MVSVVVLRPFDYLGRQVEAGESVELEAIDAAVKAREGLVSLMHGNTYQTRDMVAATPGQAMTMGSFEAPEPTVDAVPETPPKRRRGRPRKAL